MGIPQGEFLNRFKSEFNRRFSQFEPIRWSGGQRIANCGKLPYNLDLRRGRKWRPGERFELGDARCDPASCSVIVEFESDKVVAHNLLKYWPYVRRELRDASDRRIEPRLPILLCHFSNWYSYGSYRDLWQWLFDRIREDPARKVYFDACQFDYDESSPKRTEEFIRKSLDWLEEKIALLKGRKTADVEVT